MKTHGRIEETETAKMARSNRVYLVTYEPDQSSKRYLFIEDGIVTGMNIART